MNDLERLRSIVHSFYPRNLRASDPGYQDTIEHRRLVAARRQAGRDNEAWRNLRERLARRFPDRPIQDNSLHLPGGNWDACYSALLWLAPRPGEPREIDHALGFMLSFIVPHFLVYSCSTLETEDGAEPVSTGEVEFGPDTLIVHSSPAQVVAPVSRYDVRYSFSEDEAPHANAIAEEIHGAFPGWTALSPEIGLTVVPDVVAGNRGLGEATLFDCLFTDSRA